MLFCASGEHKLIMFLVCSGFHYCNLQPLHVTVPTLLTSPPRVSFNCSVPQFTHMERKLPSLAKQCGRSRNKLANASLQPSTQGSQHLENNPPLPREALSAWPRGDCFAHAAVALSIFVPAAALTIPYLPLNSCSFPILHL